MSKVTRIRSAYHFPCFPARSPTSASTIRPATSGFPHLANLHRLLAETRFPATRRPDLDLESGLRRGEPRGQAHCKATASSVEFACPVVGNTLDDATYRFSTPCTFSSASTTLCAGSLPSASFPPGGSHPSPARRPAHATALPDTSTPAANAIRPQRLIQHRVRVDHALPSCSVKRKSMMARGTPNESTSLPIAMRLSRWGTCSAW